MDIIDEIIKIKEKIPFFLENQRVNEEVDYYKYSMSGDLMDRNKHWNVGSSIFAAKIAYTIGISKDDELVKSAMRYIQSFQQEDGYIYDEYIYKTSIRKKAIQQLKQFKIPKFENHEYKRAESRQAYSALLMYDYQPRNMPIDEIINRNEMDSYLGKLDWNQPWGAASHFSHMLFFQKLARVSGKITQSQYDENIAYAKRWIDKIQNKENGSWYVGTTTTQQAINGAMKVLTGFNAIGELPINEMTGRKLVDLCLDNLNDEQACDNFNIIYVLKNASLVCDKDYRRDEIIEFAEKRFKLFLDYYYPQYGGFSFYKGQSNKNYYGCKIARGKEEPDIHGTTLFMWGIAVISEILGISSEVGLKEFIP